MSAPRMRLILSPEAETDLEDTLLYTEQQYGAQQRERYRDRLAEVLTLLSEHPHMGSPRDELPAHYRVFPVEQHRIIFFVTEDAVNVLRILHRSRDILRHI